MNTLLSKSWDQSNGYVKRSLGYIFSGISFQSFPYQKTALWSLLTLTLSSLAVIPTFFYNLFNEVNFLLHEIGGGKITLAGEYTKLREGFTSFGQKIRDLFTKLLDKIKNVGRPTILNKVSPADQSTEK